MSLKLGQIFDEVVKLSKSTQDTNNRGGWLILWAILKNGVAEGVTSMVNEFNQEMISGWSLIEKTKLCLLG